ncbi:MAG: hypothetical protein CMQ17_08060 [Gammaproteobacteria bacterium]|nr:hypothetical protein [Gammaproteobacteria bacterium]
MFPNVNTTAFLRSLSRLILIISHFIGRIDVTKIRYHGPESALGIYPLVFGIYQYAAIIRRFTQLWCLELKLLGFVWGVGGILLMLMFAIYRLAPMVFALENVPMGILHWFALVFSVVYMAYAEGYKGFHLGFAPRVVVRATYLRSNPRLLHIILAPLFCMGYIYATNRRKLLSFGLTILIICFIIIAGLLPQPWRGILDAGVVVGLGMGVVSILYFLVLAENEPARIRTSAEVPENT